MMGISRSDIPSGPEHTSFRSSVVLSPLSEYAWQNRVSTSCSSLASINMTGSVGQISSNLVGDSHFLQDDTNRSVLTFTMCDDNRTYMLGQSNGVLPRCLSKSDTSADWEPPAGPGPGWAGARPVARRGRENASVTLSSILFVILLHFRIVRAAGILNVKILLSSKCILSFQVRLQPPLPKDCKPTDS